MNKVKRSSSVFIKITQELVYITRHYGCQLFSETFEVSKYMLVKGEINIMRKAKNEVYSDIEIAGFYQASKLYKSYKDMEEFKGKLLSLCTHVNLIYDSLHYNNLPIVKDCEKSFIEGCVNFVYKLTIHNENNNIYGKEFMEEIIGKLLRTL